MYNRHALTPFQIKLQDKAHYHSQWLKIDRMADYKGLRKLDNYFKGPLLTDLHYHARRKLDPEEFEQHMVQREAEQESLKDFHIVERVIDSRDGEDGTEYYVKCEYINNPPFWLT